MGVTICSQLLRLEGTGVGTAWLLRSCSEWCKWKAQSCNDCEPDQPHEHLGGGWLAGGRLPPGYHVVMAGSQHQISGVTQIWLMR
jgi:hypothetical protein